MNELVTIEVDHDVREMALRIGSRLGKGLSDTLQHGLLFICDQNGWKIKVDPNEVLAEGKREEIYILWMSLDAEQKAAALAVLEDPDKLRDAARLEQLAREHQTELEKWQNSCRAMREERDTLFREKLARNTPPETPTTSSAGSEFIVRGPMAERFLEWFMAQATASAKATSMAPPQKPE